MEDKSIYFNNGIPEDLFRAFSKRLYDPGPIDTFISASQMDVPVWMFWLSRKMKDKLLKDKPIPITSEYNSIIGDAIHASLEKYFKSDPDYVTEKRLYYDMEIDGRVFTISGKFDLLKKSERKISDYKTMMTKQFNFLSGDITKKKEAIKQLNVNKFLLKYGYMVVEKDGVMFKRKINFEVKHASIFTILNDWDKTKAGKFRDVPKLPYYEYYVNLADYDDIGLAIRDKIISLLKYENINVTDPDGTDEVCSYEERWQQPSTYPVFKKNKNGTLPRSPRALPGTADFKNEQQAINFINAREDADLLYFENRKEIPRRCADWCNMGTAGYCKFWNAFQASTNNNTGDNMSQVQEDIETLDQN